MPFELAFDNVFAPDKYYPHVERLRGLDGAFHFRSREMIASHRVEGYGHHVFGFGVLQVGISEFTVRC